MTSSIIAFAVGIAWLQTQAALPDLRLLQLMGVAAGLLVLLSWRWRRLHVAILPAAFLMGIVWAGALATWRLHDQLPLSSEGRDIHVVGVVSELPQLTERGVRFRFTVEQASLPVPRNVVLTWYTRPQGDDGIGAVPATTVHAGERWRFRVRLKRPHGNLNPHGFDYEAWLFERNLRATGYVRAAPDGKPVASRVSGLRLDVERMREHMRSRFLSLLQDQPYAGILVALSIGDQRAISADLWQRFNRTGTTHLMSISGLHVTMVAGLFYAIAGWGWRRSSRLPLYLPAQHVAAISGMAAALAYCLLAGFAVPAQRTLYMLATVAVVSLLRRRLAARQVLSLAVLAVLLLDPWAVLSAGFWLSFGAVALLFYVSAGRLQPGHWWQQWGRAQWAMLIGMMPLLLALFQQVSLVSPLANAIAIPVVSAAITPLTLLAALPGLQFLLWPAHWLMQALMLFIDWLAALPWAMWQQHAPPLWAIALALLGTAWLMLPRGVPVRWLALLLYLPLLFVAPERPRAGAMKVTVLDVGQGLAVHVQTLDHDLVFDTGPSFSADADSGNRVLVPYLRAAGVHQLDGVVISHEDNDHAGGAASLMQAVPARWWLTSLPFEHPLSALPVPHVACRDGQRWTWDGVHFEVLHPAAGQYLQMSPKTNTMSCVIRIVSTHGSVLLTGDIEAADERLLLQRHAAALRSDVLVAPHHGSATSSLPGFLAAVDAPRAVFTVGYRNRFRHPRSDVVARYQARGMQLFRSDEHGAVVFDFSADGIESKAIRKIGQRYWHGA